MRAGKGFTLIELIVAATLFGLIIGTTFFVVRFQLGYLFKVVSKIERQQISARVLSVIVDDVRQAKKIMPLSNQKILALRVGNNIIEYSTANNKIKRKKNNYTTYLTDVGDIDGLVFAYPGSKTIKVGLDRFSTTALLRN